MIARIALATAVAALAACPAAAAHGGGTAMGYRSSVVRVTPSVSGLAVQVLDGDDQLELTNTAGRRIVIFGYEREPYLLFTRGAVYRNAMSPATYLNEERFGNVDVPATANPKLPPDWKAAAAGVRFAWHDHRIHWMSPVPPPAVRAAKGREQHVFDWRIPGTLDGRPFRIAGSLDYKPRAHSGPPGWAFILFAGCGIATLAVVGTLVLRRRRAV